MSLPKKLLLRIVIYFIIVGYLYADFVVFQGPLSRAVRPESLESEEHIAEAKAQGIAARVYYQPIYRAQVEERMREHLWRHGLSEPVGEVKILREAILAELIDELLIKIQIKVSGANDYPVTDEEKKTALARFDARFTYPPERDHALQLQGWEWEKGTKEVEMRLAARLQREKYLQHQLTPYNEQEQTTTAREWYDSHLDSFTSSDGVTKSFDEVKPYIDEALEARQRTRGIDHFRKILRSKAKGKIEIFDDVLHAEERE